MISHECSLFCDPDIHDDDDTHVPMLQGCQLMPSGASDPLTPARQGQVIDIQCQTDTEYDTCIFTHTKPFDVGQSSYNEDRVSEAVDDNDK